MVSFLGRFACVASAHRWCLAGLAALLIPGLALAAGRTSPLADAAQARDAEAVARLLGQGADVNGRQGDGATALSWAAHWDDHEIADRLIAAGADANAANDLGVTPLALACTNASARMANRLLEAGADPNRAQTTGETPLMRASFTGNLDLVRLLLGRGADPNQAALETRQTALMWAVSEKHPANVRALLDAKADIGARSAGGFTPLLFAARVGDVESARVLLDAGADVNDRGRDNNSALVVAVASRHEALAALLLERGADPNANGAGYHALHAAASRNLLRAIEDLLAYGADPNVRLRTAPATIFGPGRGSGSEVPPLEGAKASPSGFAGSFAGATPFWIGAKNVNVEAMRLLRAGGADPSLTNGNQTTALMAAAGLTQVQGPRAQRGDVSQFYSNWSEADAVESAAYLLDSGADVDAVNASGQTALHGAAYMGGNKVVELLLRRGARVNVQDAQGQTPYRIAEGHLNVASQGVTEWPETAVLLRERGADVTLGVDGRTLLRQYVTPASSGARAQPR
jgi:ankyrin repeat protein